MFRVLALAAIALLAGLTWLTPAAEAAGKRDSRPAATRNAPRAAALQRVAISPRAPVARSSGRSSARAAAAPARGAATAARSSSRGGKQAAKASAGRGRAVAAASCGRKGRCRSQGRAVAQAQPSWQGGLPAMTMAQSSCPPGTMAVLARGHDDVTRCMPI
jgi:hypothetical protein